jgi:hypothetical protein
MFWTKNLCEVYVNSWKESIETFEMLKHTRIVTCMSVAVDGFWIDDRIGLFDTARDYTLQFTIKHTLVSTVTS